MKALFRTEDSLSLLLVRLALGIVMLPHGLQKTFGLLEGPGFSQTMAGFTKGAAQPGGVRRRGAPIN